MAGSMSDAYEAKVLNLIFNNANASATVPLGLNSASVWIALGTAATDGTFTELANTGAYARVAKSRTTTADFGAATGSSPATTANATVVTFPTATLSWGTVTHFAIFDVATYGSAASTMIYWADLTASKTIGSGDTASFAIGAITITQD